MSESSLPLVTVIVPCYNHEKYVETCLDSIFRQSYKNIEVIVVDDCSPDNSAEVIKKLQQKYDFKFIEHTENWGLPKTLNQAIKISSGAYITFLASDDLFVPDSIKVRVDWLNSNSQYLAVCGDAEVIDENDKVTNSSYIKDIRGVSYDFIVENFERSIIVNWFIPGPVFLCKRNIFDSVNVGLYDETLLFEDRDMYLRLLAKNHLGFCPVIVASYRIPSVKTLKNHSNAYQQLLLSELKNIKLFSGIPKVYLLYVIARRIISISYRKLLKLIKI